MYHPYKRPGTEMRRQQSDKSALNDEKDDKTSSPGETATNVYSILERKRFKLDPSVPSSRKRRMTKTAVSSKARPLERSKSPSTNRTNEQPFLPVTASSSGFMECLLDTPRACTDVQANRKPLDTQTYITPASNPASFLARPRTIHDAIVTHHTTNLSQLTKDNSTLLRQLGPIPFTPSSLYSQIGPTRISPVGSFIAVRTANCAKQHWNPPSLGVVIAHQFIDYLVGKRLFSYVVTFGTPVGDVTSEFAPYYGEVGFVDAAKQIMFPPLTYDDVVKRSEALHTVYARFLVHPEVKPSTIWQKARVISRPSDWPIRVQALEGPFTNIIFYAIDLLPYSQESNTAILQGGEAWKKVVITPSLLL